MASGASDDPIILVEIENAKTPRGVVSTDGRRAAFARGLLRARPRVMTVFKGTDAKRVDTCVFEVSDEREFGDGDLNAYLGRNIIDPEFWRSQRVRVTWLVEGVRKCFHEGYIEKFESILDEKSVRHVFTSRMEKHRYGRPLWYAHYGIWDREGNTLDLDKSTVNKKLGIRVGEDLVFNPRADGRLRPNKFQAIRGRPELGRLFFPSELIPDEAWNDDDHPVWDAVESWDYVDVLTYLLENLNRGEEFVNNPTVRDLRDLRAGSMPPVENLTVKRGRYLPEILDEILNPYGYRWYLDFRTFRSAPRIKIVQATTLEAARPPVSLRRQTPGSDVSVTSGDISYSDAHTWKMTADIVSRSFNSVKAFGDYPAVETAFELVPGWEKKYDDVPGYVLNDFREDSDRVTTEPEIMRAWRDFVLNEAGDYNKERDLTTFDLEEIFVEIFGKIRPIDEENRYTYPGRKKFLPTITKFNNTGSRGTAAGGIFVEYTEIKQGEEDSWQPIERLHGATNVQLLQRECGIRFPTRSQAVLELMKLGIFNFKIRVTATILGDIPIARTRERAASSPLDTAQFQTFILPQKFKLRTIAKESPFIEDVRKRILATTATPTAEIKAMDTFVDDQLRRNVRSFIGGTVTLNRIDNLNDYLARFIDKVQGMEFGLDAYPVVPALTGYAFCVGVLYDCQKHSTQLTLETF